MENYYGMSEAEYWYLHFVNGSMDPTMPANYEELLSL